MGMTGILVRVGASLRASRLASGVAPTPGVSGSPGKSGMAATEPGCAPCSLLKLLSGSEARHDDLALCVDAVAGQLLVVPGHALVDVHEGSGHVAVDGVGVVDGKLLRGLAGGRVLLQGGRGGGGRG